MSTQQYSICAEDGTFRNAKYPDVVPPELQLLGGVDTVYDLFERSCERWATYPMFGTLNPSRTDYSWITYSEVRQRVKAIAAGLQSQGILERGNRVGILSETRAEWQLAAFASDQLGLCLCSMYEGTDKHSLAHVMSRTGMKAVFVSKKNLPSLLSALQYLGMEDEQKQQFANSYAGVVEVATHLEAYQNLRTVIVLDVAADALQSAVGEEATVPDHVRLLSLPDLETRGSLIVGQFQPTPLGPDDTCIMFLTSGTTGLPRIVPYRASQFFFSLGGVVSFVSPPPGPSDAYLAYLPLAHVLERALELALLAHGARVGFFGGNVKKLLDDISILKPTVIGGVPTVFDRIHDRIISQIQSSLIAKLLWKLNVPLLRTFIYDRIKAAFGGRLRLFASSGAPLRPQVAQLLCECIAPVLIIYGATETGCSLCTMPEVPSQLGTIGVPIPGIRVKLDPVEDFAKDHEDVGEIWVSGPSVCDGYLGEAADDFTSEDGGTWFRTGDIAKKNADGTFSIIDRRKNFVKTSHGEYVALQHVEKVLTESPIVESIWCYADPSKPSVVAVVAVNEQHMREDLDVSDVDQACENPEVQKAVVKVFENLGKQRGLRTFEIPKAVYLQKKPFSMEEGEVTPTFKLVRRTLQQRYKQQLDSLYESIGSKSGGDGQSAAGKATSPRSNGSASSSSTAAQNAKATPSRAM